MGLAPRHPACRGASERTGGGRRGGSGGDRRTVTAMEYAAFMLQYRAGFFCMMLLGCMLTQEYIVDSYVKVETGRLRWQRTNQRTLRADLFRGLQDAVGAGDHDAARVGRRTILASSFAGGPRHMAQLFQDAMAAVRVLGKPDLFITFTCNPNWPEIRDALLEGQTATYRPDLTARVFRMKAKQLVDDIVKDQAFGPVLAYFWVIEFQKRGLPHMHMLLMLRDKPTTADHYDRVVCAELPDPDLEPDLYEAVKRRMLHGPCGDLNRGAPCMPQEGEGDG
eukprot:9499336-Pyramimonas_sp.AAC.1